MEKSIKNGTNNDTMTVVNHSRGIKRRVGRRLGHAFLTVRDWFEDRDSNNYSVDTHNWETKTLLIKNLRNQ